MQARPPMEDAERSNHDSLTLAQELLSSCIHSYCHVYLGTCSTSFPYSTFWHCELQLHISRRFLVQNTVVQHLQVCKCDRCMLHIHAQGSAQERVRPLAEDAIPATGTRCWFSLQHVLVKTGLVREAFVRELGHCRWLVFGLGACLNGL